MSNIFPGGAKNFLVVQIPPGYGPELEFADSFAARLIDVSACTG